MKTIRLVHKWRHALWQMPLIIVFATSAAFLVNSLRRDSLPLFGKWSETPPLTTVSGERLDISFKEASRLFRENAAVFMDARSETEYARGHIRGALNLSWEEVDDHFLTATAALSPGTPIITYCEGDTCRSSYNLALFLRDMGFTNVKVLVNGWSLWKKAGLPAAEKKTVPR